MKRSVPRRWRIVAAALAVAAIATFASIAWATPTANTRALAGGIQVWHAAGNAAVDVSGFNNTILGSVNLSAGTYLFHAKVMVSDSNQAESFECRIVDLNGNIDDVSVKTAAAFEKAGLPLQGLATYASKQTVTLRCDAGDAAARASWWRLDAVKVNIVH
jgi:hypothetical protein